MPSPPASRSHSYAPGRNHCPDLLKDGGKWDKTGENGSCARVEIVVRTDNLRALRSRGVGPDLCDHGLQLLEVGQHRLCRPAVLCQPHEDKGR